MKYKTLVDLKRYNVVFFITNQIKRLKYSNDHLTKNWDNFDD